MKIWEDTEEWRKKVSVPDQLLRKKGLPTTKDIQEYVDTFNTQLDPLKEQVNTLTKNLHEANKNLKIAEEEAANAVSFDWSPPVIEEASTGDIPEGKVVWKKAYEIFPELPDNYDFDVPYWEWEHEHPHVPAKRTGYNFRENILVPLLYCLVKNEKAWLQGHTGTGKTTLIEQVCHRLNWPFVRINFDSEITRYDILGKMDLVEENGVTITKWVDGLIPQAMSGPYVCCFDELDFVRPDIAYTMQSILEGGKLRILEDAGREVVPHQMFRMVATGNTVGQGDEHGLYNGARPQSMAFLNRFPCWIHVEYLNKEEREELVSNLVPSLTYKYKVPLLKYVSLHLTAFENAEVIQPISPRTFISIAEKTMFYVTCKHEKPLYKAVYDTVICASNLSDRTVLLGLLDRVGE
jgi:cobaltochelatase CobS subunit